MPSIAELAPAIAASDADAIPADQNGIVRKVTRAQLLAGMQPALALPAATLLGRSGSSAGAPLPIQIGAGLALTGNVLAAIGSVAAPPGALPVEAFGAVGDGVADDTRALVRAVASGAPLIFGPRTYRVAGPWTIEREASLAGAGRRTVLRADADGDGTWINVTAPAFAADGIVFDANGQAGHGLAVSDTCPQFALRNCTIRNAGGHGLSLQVGPYATLQVQHCTFVANGGDGVAASDTGPGTEISGNTCTGNQNGISIGALAALPFDSPMTSSGALLSGNLCHSNRHWGVLASGEGLQILQNRCLQNAAGGIRALVRGGTVLGCQVKGPGAAGLDLTGSTESLASGNLVDDCAVAVRVGSTRNLRICGNMLGASGFAIAGRSIEVDEAEGVIGAATSGLVVQDNTIRIPDGAIGIALDDAPSGTAILGNRFDGAMNQALCVNAATLVVRDNQGPPDGAVLAVSGGVSQLTIPDLAELADLPTTAAPIAGMMFRHQAAMAGRVAFVTVTNAGRGYTQATVQLSGGGSDASAAALLREGLVIGVRVTNVGHGYGTGPVTVTITGDGQGASAVATVGLPVPRGRGLRLFVSGAASFLRQGATPPQSDWTGGDVVAPAGAVLDWIGDGSGWRVVSTSPANALSTGSDGELVLSSHGDITLRPGGHVYLAAAQDSVLSAIGHGTPEGDVAAPPGSDYRNLDGGAGTTLWIKRSGTLALGWAPVA